MRAPGAAARRCQPRRAPCHSGAQCRARRCGESRPRGRRAADRALRKVAWPLVRRARKALRAELAAKAQPRGLHRVRLRAALQRPGEQRRGEHAHRAEQRGCEIPPVGALHPEPGHDVALPVEVVAEHPDVPLVHERLPVVAHPPQPFELRPHQQGQRAARANRARKSGVQPQRNGCCGRIDAQPAAAGEEYFGPGVRVRLAHREDPIDRIRIAAEIAGHDARRQPRGAHQEDERGGEMLAESGAGREQELVDRIAPERRRLERVREPAAAKKVHRARDDLGLARRSAAPFLGKVLRLRVEARRKPHRCAQQQRVLGGIRLGVGDRGHLVAQPGAHRSHRKQMPLGREIRARRPLRRRFEREQPVAVVGFEQHAVAQGRPSAQPRRALGEMSLPGAPRTPVEVRQHRPAPVALARRRNRPGKFGTERERVRLREVGDRSRRHRVVETGNRGLRVLRQAPHRTLHTREQQK